MIQENTTTSPSCKSTACGNEVHFPGLTSSATHSRNSSAPSSRQMAPGARHGQIGVKLGFWHGHNKSIDIRHDDLLDCCFKKQNKQLRTAIAIQQARKCNKHKKSRPAACLHGADAAYIASAFSTAPTSCLSSGVTLLGKLSTTLPL